MTSDIKQARAHLDEVYDGVGSEKYLTRCASVATAHALLAMYDLLDERLPKLRPTVALGDVNMSQIHFVGPDEDAPASTETGTGATESDTGPSQAPVDPPTRHDELVVLLTEIRDRLPEPEGVKEEPAPAFYNPDLAARNLDALKHEIETPMREHGECCEPDEGPDEALAKVIHEAYDEFLGWEHVAYAAREHIEGEMDKCYAKEDATAHDRAEKAELELKIVRDAFESAARRSDHWKARAEEAWAERDEMKQRFDEVHQQAIANAEAADRWRARHAALRADVEALRRNPKSLTDVLMRAADILDRDDARDPQADPDTVTLRREGLTEPTILRLAATGLRNNYHLGFFCRPKSLPATLDALADALEADQ